MWGQLGHLDCEEAEERESVCVCVCVASKAKRRSGDERRGGTREAEVKLMVWEKRMEVLEEECCSPSVAIRRILESANRSELIE